MRICPNCSSANADGNAYCAACGCPLNSQTAPVVPEEAVYRTRQSLPVQAPAQQSFIDRQRAIFRKYIPPSANSNLVKAILSLVFGVFSIVMFMNKDSILCGVVLAVVGVVIGALARKAIPVGGPHRGLATGGFITSLIVLGLAALAIVGLILFVCICAITGSTSIIYELLGSMLL